MRGRPNRMNEPNGRVIAVVDDDASLRRSFRNLLMSAGFRVETFESAEVFLESGAPDHTGCLVLDLRMPGMGGLGLLRHLAASGSRIPVIVGKVFSLAPPPVGGYLYLVANQCVEII